MRPAQVNTPITESKTEKPSYIPDGNAVLPHVHTFKLLAARPTCMCVHHLRAHGNASAGRANLSRINLHLPH